ncbi:universal stress protein [Halostella sp. PRR32]|uniref:universal stress protein n=1 Tax=Halostella sp. PRR32 TaxID=3098147 RepID=UPI00110F525D|nr:universal stress protein [Halostella sp. PRR32]
METEQALDADDPLAVETVLVPVDGSDSSVRAVDYAAAVADRYDATVHAVYVLGEEMVRAIETDSIDETEAANKAQSFIRDVADQVAEYDVSMTNSTAYGFSTTSKMTHPGSVVLDTADDVDADFIVVPREPLSGEPGEILSKAAEYVLLYASQPVLSV